MTAELMVDFAGLDKLFYAMNEVGDQSGDLSSYFATQVCDPTGFDYSTCALQPIADVLPQMAGWFDQAMTGFGTAWGQVGHAIYASARHLEQQDDLVRHDLDSYRGPGGRCDYSPPGPGYIENFHIKPLSGALADPADGESHMDHDNRFDAAADAWDTARDTINTGIDLLNKIGAGIGKLPEQGLRDYIVYPLAADYTAIGRNANACTTMNAGFDAWAHNFGQLAMKTPQAMTGQTGAAVVGVFTAFDVGMDLVGDAVSKGKYVFDGIAWVSEKIAVEVEKVLVLLGTKITTLASKVTGRVIPGVGEIILAWNLVTDLFSGDPLGQFKDIIDDIETVRNIIDDCLNLKESILAWAESQAQRLATFHDVLDTLSGLPAVGNLPGLDDLTHRVGGLEHSLDDVDYGGDDNGERGDLDSELGDLSGETGSEGGSEDGDSSADSLDGQIVDPPMPGAPAVA